MKRIDAHAVGIASVVLGAGRSRKEDTVLPGVGIVFSRMAGEQVSAGDELCTVHAENDAKLAEACALVASAYELGPDRLRPGTRVLEEIA